MILKEIRKARGISQDKVAEELGISLRAYQNYEYGAREPNLDMLNKLADYFDVTVDCILGREKAPDPFGALNLSTEDEQEVFAKYLSLPESVRAVILDVMLQLGDAARAHRAAAQDMPELTETTTAGAAHDRLADDAAAEESAV